jgi:hypothetical protein
MLVVDVGCECYDPVQMPRCWKTNAETGNKEGGGDLKQQTLLKKREHAMRNAVVNEDRTRSFVHASLSMCFVGVQVAQLASGWFGCDGIARIQKHSRMVLLFSRSVGID